VRVRVGQGEVRKTRTGNAMPPCLLKGDITGTHAERGGEGGGGVAW